MKTQFSFRLFPEPYHLHKVQTWSLYYLEEYRDSGRWSFLSSLFILILKCFHLDLQNVWKL